MDNGSNGANKPPNATPPGGGVIKETTTDPSVLRGLDRLFVNYYGQITNATATTNPTKQDFGDANQPDYWILRLKSSDCVTGLLIRRSGGRDVQIDLAGPASLAGATIAGTLAQLTVRNPIEVDLSINGGLQNSDPVPLTNIIGSASAEISADDLDSVLVQGSVIVSPLDMTLQTAGTTAIAASISGTGASCWGQEEKIILPGSATITIVPPVGNTVTISYSIAAVKGYDPSAIF